MFKNVHLISKIVSLCAIGVLLYFFVPKLYPALQSYEQTAYELTSLGSDYTVAKITNPLKRDQGMQQLQRLVTEPEGLLIVEVKDANVRTSVDFSRADNIAWIAQPGERYTYYDTSDLNGTTWYQILKPGTFDELYWISGAVTRVMSSQDYQLSETGIELVEELVENYAQSKKDAYEAHQFEPLAPYLIDNTVLHRNEKYNIENELANGFETNVLNIELADYIYINEEYVFVRLIESYNVQSKTNESADYYYMRDYLVKAFEQPTLSVRFYELLSSAQMTQ